MVYRGADANLTAPPYAETEEGDDSNPERVEPMRRAVGSVSVVDRLRRREVREPAATDAPPALVALGVNASRDCHLTISNDGHRFDDQSWLGGEGGEGGEGGASPWVTRMGNAASVPFRYDDRVPVPTSAESSHAADALRHQLGFASRGPFAGGTEVTIRGDGFLRGDALACRFEEEGDGGDGEAPPHPVIATTRARFVDARTIVCVAPPRHPRPRAPSDAATMAPCFEAAVSVSNDGASWIRTWAKFVAERHLYCDVYVHPAARHVNPERAFGTPDRPCAERASRLLGDVTRREAFFVARIRRTREPRVSE